MVRGLDLSESIRFGPLTVPKASIIEDESGIYALVSDGLNAVIWNQAHESIAYVISRHRDAWFYTFKTDHDAATGFCSTPGIISSDTLSFAEFSELHDQVTAQRRLDSLSGGLVQVHTHTEYSALDGLTTMEELIREVTAQNAPGVCVTDHGVCAGHPDLIKAANKADIVPVCGIEAYFVPNRLLKEGGQNYNHLVLWADGPKGLKNLWGASTEANRTGFYYKPRMDFAVLAEHNEGLIASTACLRGVLADALLKERFQEAESILARFMGIFPDRLYLEIHANSLPEQIVLNNFLVAMGRKHGIPLIAAIDSHYPCAGDYDLHQRWLKAQLHSNKNKESDDSGLFTGKQDYHLMSREEVRNALSYLPADAVEEALKSTVDLVKRIRPYDLVKSEPPVFAIQEGRYYAIKRLVDMCLANWDRKIVGRPHTHPVSTYMQRFEYEMDILKKKDFCDYYCIVADYVRAAKQAGILVGPGRGSGTASLVAYLADITEVDPVEYDLPFARFITVDRVDPPDFDIDFPASKRDWIQHYVAERWGIDNVARVGTHIRLKNKGAFRDAARVLREEFPIDFSDIDAICKVIDAEEAGEAGLGKPWEDIYYSSQELLAPYAEKYPTLFEMVERIVLRLKSYGKHAAGLVISTGEPLTGRLPMRQGDENQMVAEFDYPALEAMGLLKFDFLTLRNLDTLQACVDLIKEERGISINFYDWVEEYKDPAVWDALSEGKTMGVFQFETPSMTRLVKRMVPQSIRNLADINALVRPGPQRSGMTELYFRRREGKEPVSYPHPLLEPILCHTQGVVIYQEQVMNIAKALAGFDDVNADSVRKILGKKLPEKAAAKGKEFVSGCVANGIDEGLAQGLWDQMAEFAKYGFSVCHAVPYSIVGHWCSWLRENYPEEFLTALLSTVDKDRVPDFVMECQKMGFKVLPPDINESRQDFSHNGLNVRYGFMGVKGLGVETIKAIEALQPFESYEDFRKRAAVKGSKINFGAVKTLAAVGALDSLFPNRKMLEAMLQEESEGNHEICVNKSEEINAWGLPCSYPWDEEPVTFTAKGKPIKRKDPPKRCTKACRHYSPKGLSIRQMNDYTPEEIQDREMEMLGVWLSSTPFDKLGDAWGSVIFSGEEIEAAPIGHYSTAGILKATRSTRDVAGRSMGFIEILAKDTTLTAVVFSKDWEKYHSMFSIGKLGFYQLLKTERGYTLKFFSKL